MSELSRSQQNFKRRNLSCCLLGRNQNFRVHDVGRSCPVWKNGGAEGRVEFYLMCAADGTFCARNFVSAFSNVLPENLKQVATANRCRDMRSQLQQEFTVLQGMPAGITCPQNN